jgi:hypothetical protein
LDLGGLYSDCFGLCGQQSGFRVPTNIGQATPITRQGGDKTLLLKAKNYFNMTFLFIKGF